MVFFALHHLPAELAVRTYKIYGERTMELLYQDPYLLMDDGLDAPFAPVDAFAVELGVAADDPRRVEAGLLFEMRYNLAAGHSFLPGDKLALATGQLLSIPQEAAAEGINRLLEAKRLIGDRLAGIDIVYLPELYQAETEAARRLRELAEEEYGAPADLEEMLAQAERSSGLEYAPQQARAIREAAQSGVLLITGGPGTGKTTILNGVLSLYSQMGLKCLLAAPTGRAAKRLTEVTAVNAPLW